MKQIVIHIDGDGTLFDFTNPFLRWAWENNKCVSTLSADVVPTARTVNRYDYSEGIEWESPILLAISEFYKSPEFSRLPQLALIPLLEELKVVTGAKMNVVTKVFTRHGMRNRASQVVRDYPGVFDMISFCPYSTDKVDFILNDPRIQALNCGGGEALHVLIDDDPKEFTRRTSVMCVGVNDTWVSPHIFDDWLSLHNHQDPMVATSTNFALRLLVEMFIDGGIQTGGYNVPSVRPRDGEPQASETACLPVLAG